MKSILFLISFLCLNFCNAQSDTLQIVYKNTSKEKYINFILSDDRIVALSVKGELVVFDQEDGNKIVLDIGVQSIKHLTTDQDKNIVVSDSYNVYRLDSNKNKATKIHISTDKITGILFDKANNCFVLTAKGILNTQNKQIYFSGKSLSGGKKTVWFEQPTYMMDKDDNIWLGFGYGEFGGDLFVFNTQTKQFVQPNSANFNMNGRPVVSFAEGNNKVFVGSGLNHLMTSGSIVAFENYKSSKIFESSSRSKNDGRQKITAGECVGPLFYKDDNLYIYTQNGIFKGDIHSDLTEIKKWTLLVNAQLKPINKASTTNYQAMDLIKFVVLESDKIIFLSENDGIGVLREKQLLLIN
jgi:outer membrane protein assembly factor BamB